MCFVIVAGIAVLVESAVVSRSIRSGGEISVGWGIVLICGAVLKIILCAIIVALKGAGADLNIAEVWGRLTASVGQAMPVIRTGNTICSVAGLMVWAWALAKEIRMRRCKK